jgi:hypothetical protein
VGDGSIKERLGYAHTHLLMLKPDNLPERLRERFEALVAALNSKVEHFSYKPSIVQMRRPQSGRVAEEILSIFVELKGGLRH